jgi:hypothetical protein
VRAFIKRWRGKRVVMMERFLRARS